MIVGNLVFYQHDSLARDTPKKYIYITLIDGRLNMIFQVLYSLSLA